MFRIFSCTMFVRHFCLKITIFAVLLILSLVCELVWALLGLPSLPSLSGMDLEDLDCKAPF